jgi:hypothetical protein
VKQTTIRISRLELQIRGSHPRATDVARKIAEQMALLRGAVLPRPLEAALADRLTAPLDREWRK